MVKKTIITFAACILVVVAVCLSVWAGHTGQVGLPQAITTESACPVAGCTAEECHAGGAAPEPDGTFDMTCPKAGCTSADCHAWEQLTSHYNQPSDASMNLWILAPALFVIGLVLVVRHV